MPSDNEPAKMLLPYLQRADELQNHEPLVAYYCRLYAMERGLKIPQSERTKTTNSILKSLINQLEKDKKSLKLSPDDHLHLEGFALNVFAKADKQDRAGRADLNTAKTFYAASIFFEILNQFGELAPDLEQKQKYAVWKAADIRKAIKEGRKPVPGPPGGETDLSSPSSTSGGYDLEQRNTGYDAISGPEHDPMSSSQFPDGLGRQISPNIPPLAHDPMTTPQFPDGLGRQHSTNITRAPSSANISPSPPSFPIGDYSSHSADYHPQDYQSSQPSGMLENPTYRQPYHTESYPQEPQHPPHLPQNYLSQETPASCAYPNFQSYPSFSDSSLPAAPSHYPSYYQGSDASYSHHSVPSMTNYSSAPEYNPSSTNGNAPRAPSTTAQVYHYDSNYQVPPEKIAEAQKAARFAVAALAFDEVPVAVEHLKKALELLTNPSAGQ